MNITPIGMTKTEIDPAEIPPYTDADAPAEERITEADVSSPLDEDPFADEGAPAPTTPDEPQVAPHLQPMIAPPRVSIAVIGSAEWGARSAALEAVQDFWHQSGASEVILHVSGCPTGAERVVADAAKQLGWTIVGVRDEDLPRLGLAHAFAFIRNFSEGAERALAIVRDAGVPTYVLREEMPATRRDSWANR